MSHVPVLLNQVLDLLAVRPGGSYLDATLGSGGHAEAVLAASAPDGRLLGIDRDPAALDRTRRRLSAAGDRFITAHGSFAQLDEIALRAGFDGFDGILMDLGYSSDQLADPARGLSFQVEGPLDMRLDPTSGPTAAELVNGLPVDELADVLYELGEERRSRRIARAIADARPLHTTTELADVVHSAVGRGGGRIHPATRTFQALRIAVNDELETLRQALPKAVECLVAGGRLVVVSFHSLEDRIVKRMFKTSASDCICPPELPECRCRHTPTVRVLTRRPVTPDEDETSRNPRARSAKLRAAERLAVTARGGTP